ncbi:cytochrome d ubiquinol oxidase subunit II [Nocardia salmonicida]|uniref:cytochrome d ubiquinol oxidase subunit II n=1 Tax=Nocardia salmonicida TaxID=53431 RepID=UPI003CF3ABE9
MTDAVAVVLFAAITAYALFAGADFGAGFWDLVAGGAIRGERPRATIDRAIGPVWEADHVWLIFCFVVLWTAFPTVYASITLTLFVPLTLAALGIVARGASFAFRKAVLRTRDQRRFGAAFALSSVLVPFCFGAVVGAIVGGRVPPGGRAGDPVSSWINPVSILGGVLAVVIFAWLAAVRLTCDAHRLGDEEMTTYFRRRALGSAVVAGILATAAIPVLAHSADHLFDGLTSRALPFVIVSMVAGAASLVLVYRRDDRFGRATSAVTLIALILAWGVAQWPYLLPETTTVDEAAAPSGTLTALLVATVALVVIVIPALILLYVLDQRNLLPEEGADN